jgi:selenocysteine lyase/cysteine desulfurase
VEPIVPDSMIGSMAAVALRASTAPTDDAAADELTTSLAEQDRIEVPVNAFPVRAARDAGVQPTAALLRISAQRYNEPADFDLLARALVRRGLASKGSAEPSKAAASRDASAIVTG